MLVQLDNLPRKRVKTEGWQVFQGPLNNQSIGSYAVSTAGPSERVWVSYDNQDVAISKSKYIISEGLGGAFVYHLAFEDFGNRCGAGHNPVTTAIRTTLIGPYQRVMVNGKPSIGDSTTGVESGGENLEKGLIVISFSMFFHILFFIIFFTGLIWFTLVYSSTLIWEKIRS